VSDRIEVDSRVVRPQSKVYLMLNKPRGLVTTASDEKNRDTIYSCLSADLPWVAPVGRLDKASEGLILLTNDSEWAARISAPETHLDKIYHVQVGSVVNDELVARLVNGIDLESEGGARNVLRAKGARVVRTGERNAWLEVVLDEGKNRQIRRMCECVGVEVLRLVRISVGPLHLGQLAKGSFRRLSLEEKQLLDRAMRSGAGKQSK
jgi:23S rRNA pseudouridine2605 synthase